ncbi:MULTISPECIES: amidase [unclassified Pseudomonas]|uniref:amidase n=2 Tax=Pseudomonas TaxID=286 RepID=UPI00070265C6|nr:MULTISPECIES: amidase [unclassified Pseudomonas]KQM54027.1 glutamyl-tRNA amidotransferase [Pseudomonas sp. Leaf15]MCF5238913.1 amidase [Pseudomonas sp. PA-5-4G]MCF5248948.1 amidase [Pseudomonas sp. PA-5-4B]MCF5255333.1 amidase [Pseudomonas sp. PA-5-4B]MCF5261739.1 amidase [Pseudomonas sp. PA-5-4A]
MTLVIEQLSLGADGPTVMVKDTLDIAGLPTRASSQALDDAAPATAHADVVQALLDKGCRLVGKTRLHELAFGTTGINHWTGTAPNPRFPGRIPGGSSSGSAAAVAAGLVDFSLGTDTGGSVRIPACCCGVFGFKPTFGRVSRRGVMPAHSSLDCVGPFAASLPMLVTAMQAIDPTFTPAPAPAAPRLGVVTVQASAAVQRVIDAAITGSQLPNEALTLPSLKAAYDAGMVVINRETFDACGHLLATGKVGADIAARLAAAGNTTATALAEAEQVRLRFTAEVDAALQQVDVLVLPTMPEFPLALAEATDTQAVLGMTAFVRPFNLSGHPALSIPLASAEGLPVGLQLVGAKGADEQMLAIAGRLLERLYAGYEA